MERLIDFLKTTAFGGLFVLLPILLLYLLIAEALDLIVALATPIADLFPKETFDRIDHPVLVGLILILVPWSPTAFAGSVKNVREDQVELMDSNLGDVSRVLSYWGVGVRDLLKKSDMGVENG